MAHHKFPSWRYGPKGESGVFESEEDVPNGWHDHPSKHETSPTPKPKAAAKKPGRKPKVKPAALDL